jgi:hypothetical protein
MYGISSSEEQVWAANPQIVVDWYMNNIIYRYRNNKGVNIFVWNEPHYGVWGGSNLDGGITSGYWNAMKVICQALHEANPNLLMIVHANTDSGFSRILRTDPIPTPNVIYTWHYYYCYYPAFNPYLGWMSGVLDPNYQELVNRGMPFFQTYYYGNYTKARQEFEKWLYDSYLWVPTELNLSIVNDEFGFAGDEEPFFSHRACQTCLKNNDDVPEPDITFWYVSQTLDAPGGNHVNAPYPNVTYCPRCGDALPRPHEHLEPGWPQCMQDLIEIMEKYYCGWNYFAWWTKTYAGYGLTLDDMTTLSGIGLVLKDCLSG